VPAPKPPGPGEIQVALNASGLNFSDLVKFSGTYQVQTPRPFVVGGEASGRVVAVGSSVQDLLIGDVVLAPTGCVRFQTLRANEATKVPDGIDLTVAASFRQNYQTAIDGLLRAQLRPGETLLVQGAAGGVGLAAVDIAKAYGARVVAAVSNKEKAEVCIGYGVDDVIVYGSKKLDKDGQIAFTKELKSKSKRGGYSIIYDPVGDCFSEPALRSIGWGGTYLVVGFAAGKIPSLPSNLMLLKGCAVSGVFIGRFQKEEPVVHAKNLKTLGALLAEGKINPLISKTVPMKDAVSSIEDIARRKILGKVVFLND